MTKAKVYQYTSTKGTVLTSVDLEMGNPKILYQLGAEKGKILTNGITKVHFITIPENEIELWQEITEEELSIGSNDDKIDYKQLLDIITGGDSDE